MWAIFLQTLPFFALIGLGYGAGRSGFFTPEATAYLTKFVFYFALSAMLFSFSANLSLADLFDWSFVGAYVSGTDPEADRAIARMPRIDAFLRQSMDDQTPVADTWADLHALVADGPAALPGAGR